MKYRKYNINENYFNEIDTSEKAWLLGWIASDGHLAKNNSLMRLAIQSFDISIIVKLRNCLSMHEPIVPIKTISQPPWKDLSSVTINSKKLVKIIKDHFSIPHEIGAKDSIVKFPKLDNDKLKWHFIRGLFEGDGSISKVINSRKALKIKIASVSQQMKISIQDFFGKRTEKEITTSEIHWHGKNAFEFLEKVYENSEEIRLDRKYKIFLEWKERIKSGKSFLGHKETNIARSKIYSIILPNGNLYVGRGQENIMKELNITQWGIYRIAQGKPYKGFKLKSDDDNMDSIKEKGK